MESHNRLIKGTKWIVNWAGPPLGLVFLLLLADIALYKLALLFTSLSLPVEIWGTYADWALAMFPAIAVYASVRMWLSERSDRETYRIRTESYRVRIEAREGGGYWVVNGSSQPLLVLSVLMGNDTVPTMKWVASEGEIMVASGAGFEAVVLRVVGKDFRYTLSSPPVEIV